jgi:hypothetical protein
VSDKLSKLDALGEILEVTDDTRDLRRPEPLRSVGEILRGSGDPDRSEAGSPTELADRAPQLDTVMAPPVDGERPVRSPIVASEPSSAPPLSTQPSSGPVRRSSPATATKKRDLRRQTSATLPASLVDRLNTAKQHRWELSDLVVSALDHCDLAPGAAEGLLADVADDIRITRGYRVSETDLARLDHHGAAWRMNRSQVITVILPAELHRLGL